MKSIKEDWNSTAKAYEIFNNSPDSYSFNIEWPAIQKMLPELRGKEVLDLGCGTGIFTFLLEKYQPESITGIDLSEEMIQIALKKAVEKKSKAKYIQGDATVASQYIEGQVDFIFSSTTTHFLSDLPEFFKNIHISLKEGGECILSVIHPVYSAQYPIEHGDTFPEDEEWTVRYLDMRKRAYIQPWIEYNDAFENQLSTSYHYTFSDYFNAIAKAGLILEEIQEPKAPEQWKETQPFRYEDFIATPTYMIMKLKK